MFGGLISKVLLGLLAGSLVFGGVSWVGWSWEKASRIKAEAERDTAQMAASISQQQLLLYQNREEIKAKGSKQEGKLNEWQRTGDLDSLVDNFNNPGGVRRNLPANPPGGAKGPAAKYRAQGSGEAYQEAP